MQLDLFNNPRTLVDKRLPAEVHARLSRQCLEILARLQAGPATNVELLPISTRFSARIHELRKAGYKIETDLQDKSSGITTYRMK